MNNEEWLIDGYNLLHEILSSKNLSTQFPSSKTGLCASLASFASAKKQKVWIVFDGTGAAEELSVYRTLHFEAVYSQKATADQHIEKYIYQNKSTHRFVVVTNDRAITHIARGTGAQVLKNSLFLEMLKESSKERTALMDRQQADSHGFHRPFDEKLRAKGL